MSSLGELSNTSFLSQFRSGSDKVVRRPERGSPSTSEDSSLHSSVIPPIEKVNWASSGSVASEMSLGSIDHAGDSLNLTNFGEDLSFFNNMRLPETSDGFGGDFGNSLWNYQLCCSRNC